MSGKGWGKALSYLVLVVSALIILGSLAGGEWVGLIAGVALPAYVFIIAPAMRSNACNRGILVSYSEEGFQIETGQMRSIYRWDQIGPSRRFAKRLFVMIDKNRGLVIPERATTGENFVRLAAACDVK